MARETGIKVKIDGSAARPGLKEIENETKRAASGMKAAIGGALADGLKGGTDALKGALSTVKSTITSLGGLAGGLGAAELARGAIEAKAKWSDLRFGIQAAGGSAREFAEVQRRLQKISIDTAHDSQQMLDVFNGIRGETGSLTFAADSIEDVAAAARGAHKPLDQMGNIAGTLNEKFGIEAGEDLRATLADVVGLSEKGGVGFEDMAGKLGLIGAYAKEAGLQGREGFGQIVGMLNLADNANGSFKKGISAVGGLLETLGNQGQRNKIGAALGISSKDFGTNAVQQIEAVMKATRGNRAGLEKAFGGEQLKLLVDLGRTYSAAFDETKGDVKAKTAAGAEALRDAFTDASKSAVTWTDIQNEAAAQMKEGPQQIAQSMEKLRQAVARPEVVAGIEKLIGVLPKLADFLTKIIGFASENPAAAGAAAMGGIFAKGAVEAAITGAFQRGGTSAAASIAGALTKGGSPLVGALGGFGPAVAVFAIAAAAFYAASEYQAKKDAERRKAEAEDAQRMLKQKGGPLGGAYQTAGALEAATGIEFDPNTAISDATAFGATAGEEDRDRVMKERLEAKAALENKFTVKGIAAERLLAAGAQVRDASGKVIAGGAMANSSAIDPLVGGISGKAPGAGAAQADTMQKVAALPGIDPNLWATMTGQATANQLAGKVLKVEMVNGPLGAPTGAGPVTSGARPR